MLFQTLFKPALRESDIRTALRDVVDPAMLGSVQLLKQGKVMVTLEISPDQHGPEMETMRQQAEAALLGLKGVRHALVILTAERQPSSTPPPHLAQAKKQPAQLNLPGVKHIIAVGSGKGGVGKSTVALNLAIALKQSGQRVGLLDADIYGPSVPRLTGLKDSKPAHEADGRLVPLDAHGLKIMSIGFLVDEAAPMIWRGPMVQSALIQMLRDVNWIDLDILIIDMPPGTGDAQLTLAQKVPLSGAVIVSTPQDIALIDARKGLEMFRKVEVPVLGIVENMSYYCCPNCGQRSDIFGHGGARAQAEALGCPFLGEIPLHSEIRELSDAGTPITIQKPDSPQAQAFATVAKGVVQELEAQQRPAPQIIIE